MATKVLLGGVIPIHHLEDLQHHFDYAFVEPIPEQRYIDFYKKYDGLKILDNVYGKYGEENLPLKDLAAYAATINADYVIAPDRLGDWSFNLEWAEQFSRYWPQSKILVCLAGVYGGDFMLQAFHTRQYGGFCLPYRLNRVPIGDRYPRVHLLGFKCPEQFYGYLKMIDHVTLDTSEPISAAIQGINYAYQGLWTVKRPSNYLHHRMDATQLNTAKVNISHLKNWIADRSEEIPR